MNTADLKQIEERRSLGLLGIESEGGGPSGDASPCLEKDIPALIAEVRRLRDLHAQAFYRLEAIKLIVNLDETLWATIERVANRLRLSEGDE